MNIKNSLTFPRLILFSGLGLSICAAYYSIIGIASLFTGSMISVGIMASFLELAKIVMTSFLYRYWYECNKLFKMYSIGAIIILMIITAAGISGVLLSSYQSSSIEIKLMDDKITAIESQKTYSQTTLEDARKRIIQITALRNQQESRLNESLTNKMISRNPIQMAEIQQQTQEMIDQSHKDIEKQNDLIQKSINQLQTFDMEISNTKLKASGKKDILTFKFVSEAIHMELNTTVKWFIVSLITVFDPLALCLLLAYNTATFKGIRKEEVIKNIEPIIPPAIISEVKKEENVEKTPIVDIPIVEEIKTPIIEKIPDPVLEPIQDIPVTPIRNKKKQQGIRGLFSF